MSTAAQIAANQQNAKLSSGPKSEEGKAASCLNNFRHGFTGAFTVLPSEDQEKFDTLLHGLRVEHEPKTMTEILLVEKMAQHHWLVQRAMKLQELTMMSELPSRDQECRFSLYLRYQTTNERAFHKSLDQLLKLRAERRKAEIGFESQKQKEAAEARRDAAENRKQSVHKLDLMLAECKLDRELFNNWKSKNEAGLDSSREHRLMVAEKAA